MKLRMEFEDDDLREMIDGYFRQSGFKVKNLDQLCDLFKRAFPDGIEVQVATLPVAAPVEPQAKLADPAEIQDFEPDVEEIEEVEESPPRRDGNPRLSASDLFDPTPGKVPTRDEQLKQTEDELKQLLSQSKAIQEEEKVKEN